MGTDGGGVCRYDGYRFKYYNKSNGLKGNVVRKISQDTENTLWLATNNGLFYIKNDSVYSLDLIQNNLSIYFSSVFIDSKKNIWAGSSGKGIFKISLSGGKYMVKNYTSSDGLSSDYIYDICEDGKNIRFHCLSCY